MSENLSQSGGIPKETAVSVAPDSPSDGNELEKQSVKLASTQNDQDEAGTFSEARGWNPGYKLFVSLSAILSCFSMAQVADNIIVPWRPPLAYIASIDGIMEEFNVGLTLAISPITFYAIGFIIGPMATSALSEEFGRQYIYKFSLLGHLIFTIVGGSAKDFRTIAVARGMCGILGSPCVSVFAGVMNDLWKMPEDKAATALFALYGAMGVAASEIGPISGEAVVADRGWRWSFWLTAILVGISFLCMVTVPESYGPEIQRKKLGKPRRGLLEAIGPAFARPFHMLIVEPIVFPTTAIVTMGQIVVFIFYASYPIILEDAYGFSNYEQGLAFIPLLIGTLLALPVLSATMKKREKTGNPQPEDTMPAAMIAGVVLPISLFWLAWTARSDIHWICPLLAGGFYGFGFALSQLVYPLYKNEVYGAELGASSFAIDVAMRYSFSSIFPLFTIQMVDAMKFHWAISLCGFVLLVLAPVPWWLQRYGPSLRARSVYVKKAAAEGHA